MTGTARDDAAASSEQEELISCLERVQESFERRALSSMAEPLISTPITMQQLKVLTMIAIDPERATGHELAAQLNVLELVVFRELVPFDEVPALIADADVAMMAFAEAVVRDASAITEADVRLFTTLAPNPSIER